MHINFFDNFDLDYIVEVQYYCYKDIDNYKDDVDMTDVMVVVKQNMGYDQVIELFFDHGSNYEVHA